MQKRIPVNQYGGSDLNLALQPWPLVGHIPMFLRDKLRFPGMSAGTEGAVSELRLGGPTVLLKEPADIRFVLEERPESSRASAGCAFRAEEF